jgi:hypothetical protein
MNRTQLQQNLDLIKLKSQQLQNEIIQSGVLLRAYCSSVKRRIDTQAERLIDAINQIRRKKHVEIDLYEKETQSSLAVNLPIFEINFRSLCAELNAFQSMCVNNLDNVDEKLLNLSKEYLAKLENRKANLNWVMFNNRIVNFEPDMVKLEESKLFGTIFYSQVIQPILQFDSNESLVKSSNHMSFKIPEEMNFKKESLNQSLSIKGMEMFEDGKFLYYNFESSNGLRLTVLTKDFKAITQSIKFSCVDLDELLISICDQKAVLYLNFSTKAKYLIAINDDLEILNEIKFESDSAVLIKSLTAFRSQIVCLTSANEFLAYDWTFEDTTFIPKIKKTTEGYLNKCELTAGQNNQLFVHSLDQERPLLFYFDLVTGECLNSFTGFLFVWKFFVYGEKLIVVYQNNQLFYIDPVTFAIERSRNGIFLPRGDSQSRSEFYDNKSITLLNLNNEMATFFTDDGQVHFYLFKNTNLTEVNGKMFVDSINA